MSPEEYRPVFYEVPKDTGHNALQWGLRGIGTLLLLLATMILLNRSLTPECYDDTGAYDDSCSQGYERVKTP